MSENRISYLSRNYNEYREELKRITKKYYPDVFDSLDDASVGQWMIDILADVGDNLQYHIDRVYQETSVNSANQMSSLQNIARTNGLRITGKKSAICEVEISCEIPLYTQGVTSNGNLREADEMYCPYIKRGTLFSTGLVTFELVNDVDFKQQFDDNGISNRQIIPNRDSNGNIVSYTYKKLAVVVAGQSKIYKKVITSSEIKPFMEILLQDSNILGVDSIIVKQGTNLNTDPMIAEFNVDEEMYYDKSNKPIQRYFEVENLIDQFRYGYEVEQTDGKPIGKTVNDEGVPYDNYYNPVWSEEVENVKLNDGTETSLTTRLIAKGKWKRLKNKFITEYTDNWNMKIIFGSGIRNKYGTIPTDAKEFTQYMMSRMYANDYMGVLPEENTTMYILYRVGGGEISNIAKDTLTNIIYLNMQIDGNCNDGEDSKKKRDVKNSLKVTNTTPSYGGKDEPTAEEIRYMIKYNNGSQNRCVTLNDYYAILNKIPAKFGSPFRMGIVEENNKIVIYSLGLDYLGKLRNELSESVADNMKEYLKQYRMINDFIEIKSGKIINVAFELTIYVDKTYDKSEVTKRVIDTVYDYMDIRRHQMGEDIFLGDLEKNVSKLDGVINMVDLKCFNRVGINEGYSDDVITQQLVDASDCCYDDGESDNDVFDNQIDLKASDMILFSEVNSMFEIKDKSSDIIVKVKTR